MAFKIFKYGVKERIYRIRLPADASQAVRIQHTVPCPALIRGQQLSKCADGLTDLVSYANLHTTRQAVVKELMTGKSWSICAVYNTPTTLLATYKGVYLSLPLAPFLLDACAPTPPLAPAEAIIAALQPHITDLVLRFAIDSSLQAL